MTQSQEITRTETPYALLDVEPSVGILTIVVKEDTAVSLNLEQAELLYHEALQLINHQPVLVLFDVRQATDLPEPDAEDFLSKVPLIRAEAIVVKHLFQRIYGYLFARIARKNGGFPVKLFTNEVDARKWLMAQGV